MRWSFLVAPGHVSGTAGTMVPCGQILVLPLSLSIDAGRRTLVSGAASFICSEACIGGWK